jgi:hypothetical protein
MTCGDYGGLTAKGEPCKRAAGWGVPGTDEGRCKTHLEQVPEPTTHTPPLGYTYGVTVEGTLAAATAVTLTPAKAEAEQPGEPEPPPVEEPPPPSEEPPEWPIPEVPAGAQEAVVYRLTKGSGTVTVSSAWPLPPGALMPDQHRLLRVRVATPAGMVEPQVYTEPLHGTHADGSVRSVLIQFDWNAADDDAVVEIGDTARTAPDRARSSTAYSATRLMPDAALLPTDPEYLCSTRLVYHVAPLTAAPSPDLRWEQRVLERGAIRLAHHETDYATVKTDNLINRNYYDRAYAHLVWWVRSGDPSHFRAWALYAAPYWHRWWAGTGGQPHNWQPDGCAALYRMFGDEKVREMWRSKAENVRVAWVPHITDKESNYAELRIMERCALMFWHAEQMACAKPGTGWISGLWRPPPDMAQSTWRDIARIVVDTSLAWQDADGGWRPRVTMYHTLNFMLGMWCNFLGRWYEEVEKRADLVDAVARCADHMWTQWGGNNPSVPGFGYAEAYAVYEHLDPPQTHHQGPSPDLNLMIAGMFAFAFKYTGQARYLTRGDTAFAGSISDAFWPASTTSPDSYNKHHNEQLRYAHQFVTHRLKL